MLREYIVGILPPASVEGVYPSANSRASSCLDLVEVGQHRQVHHLGSKNALGSREQEHRAGCLAKYLSLVRVVLVGRSSDVGG